MVFRASVLSLTVLALAGCASTQGTRETVSRPRPPVGQVLPPEVAPGVPSPLPPVQPEMTPAEPVVVAPPPPDLPRSAESISGAAVTSLVRQARSQRAAGQPQQAQATLERALRIEPRNYFVWSALAQTHLDQKNYEQAASVAAKSNSLARGNLYVELENWKTIRAARVATGNASGAEQAQARIDSIQLALGVN